MSTTLRSSPRSAIKNTTPTTANIFAVVGEIKASLLPIVALPLHFCRTAISFLTFEILLHQAAKKHFDSLGDKKPPHVRALREQYQVLLAQKRKAYSAYKQAREEMKELYNVKSNVEHLLNISEHDTEREREKTRR